jgi:hypothetical protein
MSNIPEETGKTVRQAMENWGATARLVFILLALASCLLVVGRYTPMCTLVRPSAVRVSAPATVAYGSTAGVMPKRSTE